MSLLRITLLFLRKILKNSIFFLFLLLCSCAEKDKISGMWMNLDDSISLNNSDPVVFKQYWYLFRYENDICAVSTSRIQKNEFPTYYYYGKVNSDKIVLQYQIDDKIGENISFIVVSPKKQIDVYPEYIMANANAEPEKFVFVFNPVENIVKDNDLIKIEFTGKREIPEKCGKILNYFISINHKN